MTLSGFQDYLNLWWPFLGSIVAMVVVAAASAKSARRRATERDEAVLCPSEYANARSAATERIARVEDLLTQHERALDRLECEAVGNEFARYRASLGVLLKRLEATPSESEASQLPRDLLRKKLAAVNRCTQEVAALEESVRRLDV